jgi:hypothetical protein
MTSIDLIVLPTVLPPKDENKTRPVGKKPKKRRMDEIDKIFGF